MDVEDFWSIIENARRNAGERASAEQLEAGLTQALAHLPAPDLIGFELTFETLSRQLYSWDLWAAATVITGGCSDDGFLDFRTWVISAGREVFDAALTAPDQLATFDLDVQQILDTEGYAYVAGDLYEAATGVALAFQASDQLRALPNRAHPAGEPWDESSSDALASRMPLLSTRYARVP